MFMEILLMICIMICIPNYMMPVLFQQCYMVLKYLDIYTLVILKKYKKSIEIFYGGPQLYSNPSHDGRYGVD